MNKTNFIKIIAGNTNGNKAAAERAFDAVVQSMGESLANNELVRVDGLGTFKAKVRKGRAWSIGGYSGISKDKLWVRFNESASLDKALND